MFCRVFFISFLLLSSGSVHAAAVKLPPLICGVMQVSDHHQTQLPKRCPKRRSAKIYLPKKSTNSLFRRDHKRKSMQPKKRPEQKDDSVQSTAQPVNPLHDAGLSPRGDYVVTYQDSKDFTYSDRSHHVLSSEMRAQTASFVGDDALMQV